MNHLILMGRANMEFAEKKEKNEMKPFARGSGAATALAAGGLGGYYLGRRALKEAKRKSFGRGYRYAKRPPMRYNREGKPVPQGKPRRIAPVGSGGKTLMVDMKNPEVPDLGKLGKQPKSFRKLLEKFRKFRGK